MRLIGTTLAVAALALAGCGGDDSEDRANEPASETATTSTAPAAKREVRTLTAAQYRARVNRLCRQDKAFSDGLGEPGSADQIERYLRRTLAYAKKQDPRYAALDPPPELRAHHAQSIRLSRRLEGELEDLLERIDAGGDPAAEFGRAARPLLGLADRANRLARRMGTKDCVVEVPNPAAQQPQQTY